MTATPDGLRARDGAAPDAEGDRVVLEARIAALECENARLCTELLTANEARARFVATVSHELRTPLQVVMGYADLLQSGIPGPIPPTSREHVAHIGRAAEHLLSIVEQILTFARLESRREQLRLERTDLRVLARQAASLVTPLILRKGLRLALDVPEDDALVVETDVVKVRQVIYNLLSNAVKFTDEGEVGLVVATGHEHEEAVVRFEVRDTGCGMTASQLERAFEAFWQAERFSGTGIAPRGGTGLGLSISRELARMLGGDLTVRSEPGRGSAFTFTLPARPANGPVRAAGPVGQ